MKNMIMLKPIFIPLKNVHLCKRFSDCQWWNYDSENYGCWLKKGQGNEKRSEPQSHYEVFYTGHRDSSRQCQGREVPFNPAELSKNRNRNNDMNRGSPADSVDNINSNTMDEATQFEDSISSNDERQDSRELQERIEPEQLANENYRIATRERPVELEDSNSSNTERQNITKMEDRIEPEQHNTNPCPHGEIVENNGRCCTGELQGTDGTPRCTFV